MASSEWLNMSHLFFIASLLVLPRTPLIAALAQFFEDNFTNAQAEMRGRDKLAYQYVSRERPTIMDERELMEKNMKEYAAKVKA